MGKGVIDVGKITCVFCCLVLVFASRMSPMEEEYGGTSSRNVSLVKDFLSHSLKTAFLLGIESLGLVGQYSIARTFFDNATPAAFALGCATWTIISVATALVKKAALNKDDPIALSRDKELAFGIGISALPAAGFVAAYAAETNGKNIRRFALGTALTTLGKIASCGFKSKAKKYEFTRSKITRSKTFDDFELEASDDNLSQTL